jgi:adenylate kinase
MVAIAELFSLLGSDKSKLLILQSGAECSGSVPAFVRSLISEHVSTEALLRDESARQTPLGAALRRSAKALTPPADDTLLALLRRWYFARRSDSGFRLLGFPRNLRQSLVFDEWLEARGESLDACVLFGVPNPQASPVADHYRSMGVLLTVDAGIETIPTQS